MTSAITAVSTITAAANRLIVCSRSKLLYAFLFLVMYSYIRFYEQVFVKEPKESPIWYKNIAPVYQIASNTDAQQLNISNVVPYQNMTMVSAAQTQHNYTNHTFPTKQERGEINDKPSSDEPSSYEPSSDKPSSDESSPGEPLSDKPSSDEPSSDKLSSDEPSSDKPSSDEASSDKPSSDEQPSNKLSSDEPSSNKPSSDEPLPDKPSSDKPSSDVKDITLGITQEEQLYHQIKYLPNITTPIQPGGKCFFKSSSDKAAAIIVPIRGRIEHLKVFISYMHGFLQEQHMSYGIYIVEQIDKESFNRGFLLNVGVLSALSDYPYTCVYLHDVDLLPENQRVSYTCPNVTTHMCTAHMSYDYHLPYKKNFGGVTVAPTEDYFITMGMSNLYWGWGGEDDDFRARVLSKKLKIASKPEEEGRYLHLKHKKSTNKANNRKKLLRRTTTLSKTDGIQMIPPHLKQIHRYKYYTLVSANLMP